MENASDCSTLVDDRIGAYIAGEKINLTWLLII
jgi:hypothetical protein